jgi:hypothetical protein
MAGRGISLGANQRESVMKSFKLATVLAGALLVMPAKSAPISAVPLTQLTGADEPKAVQVRFGRGGFRGGGFHGGYRGGFHRHYGGLHRHYGGFRGYGYRGYGVRRAYLPGAVYGASYCDPTYQYCGGYGYGGYGYPGGGVYRRHVYRGGYGYRGGYRGGFGGYRGAHVAHFRGGRRR